MYFGWNLGLPQGGTLGFGIATVIIMVMYVCFTFSYAEMGCAIPKAGGAFDYASIAFGRDIGFLTGMAQNIEFIFAPPAIAFAIGAYLNTFFHFESTLIFAITAYVIFTLINMRGVNLAARFELIITIIAVFELIFFACLTLPHFHWHAFSESPLPNGVTGILRSLPFAIWFFLAIEGVANVAEEAINPQRNILFGFGSALITLIFLCIITFVSAVGVRGWKQIVYEGGVTSTGTLDTPLPLALKQIVGNNSWLMHLLVSIGIFGLVASFHGIILAAGRAILEFGRVGFAPKRLGEIHARYQTPVNALLFNMLIGIVALLSQKTSEIIILAVFGALSLYVLSMLSMIKLRRDKVQLTRPFKAPLYPILPLTALCIASVSLITMTVMYRTNALFFFGILFGSYAVFKMQRKQSFTS